MNKWWQNETVYQIYPRSFNDSNNDGTGDIKGITKKLDYFSYLGVTMLWLCPVYRSPMDDNGYDISDYEKINPEFGTMADLDELIKKAKEHHIKIILDLVINHTSDEHPWFKKALADPNSKYRDYYIFKPGVDNHAPNNWRSLFGGSAWEKVPNENNYYLHVFGKKQPDLNWENPAMKQDIYKMINWWLDKGIAGFRIDSITFIKKDQDFASLPADDNDGMVKVSKKTQNRPGIAKLLKELKANTFEKHDCMTVGEAPGVPYDQFNDFIGPDGYFSMIFDFHYADVDVKNGNEWWDRPDWTPKQFKQLLFTSQMEIQKCGWSANFLENHDQPRSISKLIKDKNYQNAIGAKALAILLLSLRGTPFIYQGEELGMTNFHRKDISEFNDLSSIHNYHAAIEHGYSKQAAIHYVNLRSRDNTRTPYPWNNQQYGGFSQTKPWLEMSGNEDRINNAAQINDADSILNFYKKLISIRNNSEYSDALIHGDIKELTDVPDNVIGFSRHDQHHLDILINFSNKEETVKNYTIKNLIIDNYKDIKTTTSEIVLKPYQAIIFESEA